MTRGFSEAAGTYAPAGGYRPDNLISNERSLQEAMPALRERRRAGGHIGVGPEQNFTYVVALEPAIAFVVDIRPDNQLLHLMYKAIAEASTDRADFLARLFGRPRPPSLRSNPDVTTLLAAFANITSSEAFATASARAVVARLRQGHGFELSDDEIAHLTAIYQRFVDGSPGMRWDDGGPWIPTFAELMAGTDPLGRPGSFLASDNAFEVLRRYQLRNRIVPLVGDFGGAIALRAIGGYLRHQQITVAAFYLSNVDSYLGGKGQQAFAKNLAVLPADERSVLIRTVFRQTGMTGARPDFQTKVVVQPARDYVRLWTE